MARHDEAIILLTRAAVAYHDASDLDGYARSMAAVGREHSTSGRVDLGIAVLESVAQSLAPAQPSHGAIAVHTVRTMLYWSASRY